MATKALLTRLEKIEEHLNKGREKVAWVVFEGDQEPTPEQVQGKDVVVKIGFRR